MKTFLINSALVVACLAASFALYRGAVLANGAFIEPAITHRIAAEAIGAGWSLEHADNVWLPRHRYIFRKGGVRRDVNVIRDGSGNWAAQVTPEFER